MRQGFIHNSDCFKEVRLLSHDLSPEIYAQLSSSQRVAWDIETNGLDPLANRIGTCQLYSREAGLFIVKAVANRSPIFLSKLLSNEKVPKIFHHAPFDLSFMAHAWGVKPKNVACTKIAAKVLDPLAAAEEYSLKHLMLRHFGINLEKQMRFTDWITDELTEEQLRYAARDVVKLLDLYDLLDEQLETQGSRELYRKCCNFLPAHVGLRLRGCPDPFSY
jgi:ribonuclease D